MGLRKSLVNSTLECSRCHKTSMLEKTWSVSWGLHHDSWRPCTLTWGSVLRMGMSFGGNNSLTWDLILAHLLYGLGDALNLPTFPIPVGETEINSRMVSTVWAIQHTSHGTMGTLSRCQDHGGPVQFRIPGKLVCGGHRCVCHSQQPALPQRWWEALNTGDGLQKSRRQKRTIERKKRRKRDIGGKRGQIGPKYASMHGQKCHDETSCFIK